MPKGFIIIDTERCKGCGLCIEICPQRLIELGGSFNSQGFRLAVFKKSKKCKGCALCALVCPDIAIKVWQEVKNGEKNTNEG